MLTEKEQKYISDSEEELKELLKKLCIIPAPSNHEEKRAEFVKNWIIANGFDSYIDEAENVIWPVNVHNDSDLFVVSAHTDVVFSDTNALPFHEDEKRYYAPGIGDDTARLAILLIAARYFATNYSELSERGLVNLNNSSDNKNNISVSSTASCHDTAYYRTNKSEKPPHNHNLGFLIVANTGEEGLGNLRGTKHLIDQYGHRIKEFITIDGNPDALVTKAVGSHRYKITVNTRGGHSYNDFGNDNAIEKLSEIIEALYKIDIPKKENTKTTLNVGNISGGTSVNTIPEEADMLFEYRSDDMECLSYMKTSFENVISSFKAGGLDVSYEILGIRPCGNVEDERAFENLKKLVKDVEEESIRIIPKETSGSTDANYPLSLGIPAVCVGAGVANMTHTREEYVYKDSLKEGLRFILSLLIEANRKYQ